MAFRNEYEANQAQLSTQQRQQRELERPVICPDCKSDWFFEQIFHQYSDQAYGSGTGGDIRVISNSQQVVRVCLCGRPFTPNVMGMRGRAATIDISSFQDSVKKAQAFRKGLTDSVKSLEEKARTAPVTPAALAGPPAPSMQKLAETFASIEETSALLEEINRLRAEVACLKAWTAVKFPQPLHLAEPLPDSLEPPAPGKRHRARPRKKPLEVAKAA